MSRLILDLADSVLEEVDEAALVLADALDEMGQAALASGVRGTHADQESIAAQWQVVLIPLLAAPEIAQLAGQVALRAKGTSGKGSAYKAPASVILYCWCVDRANRPEDMIALLAAAQRSAHSQKDETQWQKAELRACLSDRVERL